MAIGDDFTTKLMDDMDPELLEMVQSAINSFIKWDLVRFFHENPNTTGSIENIATYLGRGVVAIEPEVNELVESGFMEKRIVGQVPVYSLTLDPERRQQIAQFVTACSDRHFRVKAVYHIIRGMR
ncbi:MAG: hypothetical protein JW934_05660 [Anaerolineae bacterium]|nr:hypothetical protein [Anaerolineae bacterium]